MGLCNLAAPGADLMLARLSAREQVPLGVSPVASTPMERLIEVADGHAWSSFISAATEAAPSNWSSVRRPRAMKPLC